MLSQPHHNVVLLPIYFFSPASGLRARLLVPLPRMPVVTLETGLHVRREDLLVVLWDRFKTIGICCTRVKTRLE